QMLAIGRALMHGPKILLLDEPSMGLAPKLVLETMKIVKRLNEAGTTILLVEQNARLALRLAHYGDVLENGGITRQGEAGKLRADASIVQAYLGTWPHSSPRTLGRNKMSISWHGVIPALMTEMRQ